MREDIRREIALSKTKPVVPSRDPMPWVMGVASLACSACGLFDGIGGLEMLNHPTIKMYSYAYLILMVVFSELSVYRLTQ